MSSVTVFCEGDCPVDRAVMTGKGNSFSHSIDGILGQANEAPVSSTTCRSEPTADGTSSPLADRSSSRRRPGSSRRRARTNYTQEQLAGLEALFADNQYPGIDERDALADAVDLSEARIQVWFQNRRARLHRKQRRSLSTSSPESACGSKSREAATTTKPECDRLSTSSSPESSPASLSPPTVAPVTSLPAITASSAHHRYPQACAPSSSLSHFVQTGAQYFTGAPGSYYPWTTLSAMQPSTYYPSAYNYIYPATGSYIYDFSVPLSASYPVASVQEEQSVLGAST